MTSANASAIYPLNLPLWPDGIPNAKVTDNREVLTEREDGDLHYSLVTQPGILVYKPVATEPTAAVVICPGGGYGILSYSKEGTDVAEFLASKGIAGIVLKYRLPNRKFQVDPSIAPLQDAQRALKLSRENAAEWNIDPDRIGIMGFSAGGHLASTAAHQWKKPVIEDSSPDQLRPDFSILIYPVITFTEPFSVHSGSRRNLLGKNPSPELCKKYSAEKQVDERTPPSFLVHSFDDGSVPIENSINYARALRESNIICEAHLYQIGGHGYGMRPGHTDSWPNDMVKWIRLNFGN